MSDHLKQYLQEHRAELESENPPAAIWEKIDKELPEKQPKLRRIGLMRYVRVAAMLMVVFGLGLYLGQGDETEAEVPVSVIAEEIEETQMYYQEQVQSQLVDLKSMNLRAIEKADIAELEASFDDWKTDLGTEVTDEEVLDIMIQNYEMKIEILEQTKDRIKSGQKTTKNVNI